VENYSEKSQNELWERKWKIFEERVRLFRHVPFVEFVLLAGSMATGKVHEKSDFDVIIGVREGRVFSAWFFSAFLFQLLGWREHPGKNATNRFGMPHFAAPRGYTLTPPYDAYWNNLYSKLIPAFGDETRMAEFFSANDWIRPIRVYTRYEKYIGSVSSWCKKVIEFLLGGRIGNLLEGVLKKWLVKKIKNPKKLGYKPRVFWDDTKIELYRDTQRIEEMLKGNKI